MNGEPVYVAHFAATLRRKLFRGIIIPTYPKLLLINPLIAHCLTEHLGLIPPQVPKDGQPEITPSMRPAPHPNEEESELDELVKDPLAESTLRLWNDTARKNREVFTEIFRPVPTNLVRDWSAYEVRSHGCPYPYPLPPPPFPHSLRFSARARLDRLFHVRVQKQGYLPKMKTGHVAPGIELERVKLKLGEVRGSLVECPMVCSVLFCVRERLELMVFTGFPY